MYPLPLRFLARLDIKGPHVVKGLQMEGLRIVGAPADLATFYVQGGADELLYLDIVASLYDRVLDLTQMQHAIARAFLPVTAGGGLSTCEAIGQALREGADKVALNTGVLARPALLTEAAQRFGSQALVLQVDAKSRGTWYEVYTHGGRQPTGRDVREWLQDARSLGAGEVLISAIDRDGMLTGPDLALARLARGVLDDCPLLYSGGVRGPTDCLALARVPVEGIAIGAALHADLCSLTQCKQALAPYDIPVRLETTYA